MVMHVVMHDRCGMMISTVVSSEMMMVVACAERYKADYCKSEAENLIHGCFFLLVKVICLVKEQVKITIYKQKVKRKVKNKKIL